jgi:hypothetical protein
VLDGQATPIRPTTWLAEVVGVVGAVVPLGAVGTTGAGADQAIGAAFGEEPDDDPPVPDDGGTVDGPAVAEVDEPDLVGEVGCDVEPAAFVVDGVRPAVVEEDPPAPGAAPGPADRPPCPAARSVFDASCDGFDGAPPTERTSPTTRATTASPPTTAALRHLARRDRCTGCRPPSEPNRKMLFTN